MQHGLLQRDPRLGQPLGRQLQDLQDDASFNDRTDASERGLRTASAYSTIYPVFVTHFGWPCARCLRTGAGCYQKDTNRRCRSSAASTTRASRRACALTIGNFDGVHRGHQAMLALLNNEARHRGVPSCVLTFEPHPRDYFAAAAPQARTGAGAHRHAARQADRAGALRRRPVRRAAVRRPPGQPDARGLHRRRAGRGPGRALRAGGRRLPLRRQARRRLRHARRGRRRQRLRRGPHEQLRGARPARVQLGRARGAGRGRHGRRGGAAGPALQHQRPRGARPQARAASSGFRTLNLRFAHWKPAASGIFAVLVHGLGDAAAARRGQPGRAALAGPQRRQRRPGAAGDALPAIGPPHLGAEGGYGKIVRVELLHKLHDELRTTASMP